MEPSRPLTAEEVAIRRNTDCVYFLASPLTCKKGNECEFRHSESARVNPRDCWYWLNGNCTNPKCSFRHPPLDGLFETPMAPLPAPPSLQAAASTHIAAAPVPMAYNPNKQSVPCHFFLKGQCLKGDRCPFMHGPHQPGNNGVQQVVSGPQPIGNNNNNTQQAVKVSTLFTGATQTVTWGLKECATQQNVPKPGFDKPVQVLLPSAKSSNKGENVPNNDQSLPPRSQPIIAPVSSDSTPSRPRRRYSQPVEEQHQNGREADEFLGESSPGFDVLVEDDIGDSGYYNDEDFKRASVHGGRDEFDYNRSDYEPIASFDRDRFDGKGEYDRYARGHNQHGRDPRRASLERTDRPMLSKRRACRESSPREMEGSDLRHRLLKQRRLNGLSHRDEYRRHDDHYAADRYRGRSGGDRRDYLQENSVGSRLQGRITLPPRSPPDRPRDRDRGRHWARLSPVRSLNRQGRPQDGIRRAGDYGRPEDPLNFAGPKSLAELKGVKDSVSSQEQQTKHIDALLSGGNQASKDTVPFEGPKSLSSILKRKREIASANGSASSGGDVHDVRDGEVVFISSKAAEEGGGEEEEEGLIPTDGEAEATVHETDDSKPVDGTEDQDLENYDPRDDEYDNDYEADEGGDPNAEDEKNAYVDDDMADQEDEEVDDEDDFAKKVGVFFS